MGFVVDKVAIKQGFLSARPYFPVNYNSNRILYLFAYYMTVDNEAIRGHISPLETTTEKVLTKYSC